MSLKNYVVQWVHKPSGSIRYTETDAETPSQAIDNVFGDGSNDLYRVRDVYLCMNDVKEHYNVRPA